jgi:enoyl-[acyl-carrier protein] reductase I
MEVLDLTGRKGLVVGIANEHSLAWAAAQHFANAGAELAITYLSDKAKPFVEPLARAAGATIFPPCNVAASGELEAVFGAIRNKWGRLDFLFHSIAWARKEDLHGRLTDCSAEGFAESMLISCHSFIRMARLAKPLMVDCGSLVTLTFYNRAVILPISGRKSKFSTGGAHSTAVVFDASMLSGALVARLFTSRRQQAWSSWWRHGCWILLPAPAWRLAFRALR